MTTQTKLDVFQIATDRIIAQLEKGIIPWKQSLSKGIPVNMITKRPFTGVNVLLLASLGYEHNIFLTPTQVEEIKATVQPGENPHPVVYWKWPEKKEGEKQEPKLLYYSVFNIAQLTDVLSGEVIEQERTDRKTAMHACAYIVEHMPQQPMIKFKEKHAYYQPYHDFINMPKETSFESPESFYAAFFKELVHSTGHLSRVGRNDVVFMKTLGASPYSNEELIGEIGALFLSAIAGIELPKVNFVNLHTAEWLKKFNDEPQLIVYAAAKAQKAVDYILAVSRKEEDSKISTERLMQ